MELLEIFKEWRGQLEISSESTKESTGFPFFMTKKSKEEGQLTKLPS
jgi:hypothetical protein